MDPVGAEAARSGGDVPSDIGQPLVVYETRDYEQKHNKWREDGVFCDLTVIVENERFFVHKNILCAKAPVFETMLLSSMKESKTNEIVVNEVDVDVFRLFLDYVYTGCVSLTENVAVPLVKAAHMYEADALVQALDKVLAGSVGEDNCVCLWLLGEQLQLPAVIDCCVKFTSLHLDSAQDTNSIPCHFLESLKKNGATDTMFTMLFLKWVDAKKPIEDRVTLLNLIDFQRVSSEIGKKLTTSQDLATEEKDVIFDRLGLLYFNLKSSIRRRVHLTSQKFVPGQGSLSSGKYEEIAKTILGLLVRMDYYAHHRVTAERRIMNVEWVTVREDYPSCTDLVKPEMICIINRHSNDGGRYDLVVIRKDGGVAWKIESCRIKWLGNNGLDITCDLISTNVEEKPDVVACAKVKGSWDLPGASFYLEMIFQEEEAAE